MKFRVDERFSFYHQEPPFFAASYHNMSFKRQASLSSFFSKSKAKTSGNGDTSGGRGGGGALPAKQLSPEAKARIEANKQKALAKKLARLGVLGNLPGSWGPLLQSEVCRSAHAQLIWLFYGPCFSLCAVDEAILR